MDKTKETKFYVVRTNCYGRRPHVNYTVMLADGTSITVETPTPEALLLAQGETGFVDQVDIKNVLDELATTSQTTFDETQALNYAKENVLRIINAYDTSNAINTFVIASKQVWLDKITRAAVRVAIDSCKTAGRDTYDVWFNDTSVSIQCDKALQLLDQLEVYAVDCYNATAKHKNAVKALATIDEVVAYDYKSGYPEMLKFSL